MFRRLAATGFLEERWRSGRRPGLRAGLNLVRELAPLDGGAALAVSLHSEVFLATMQRFRRNALAASLMEQGLKGVAVGSIGITEDDGGSDPSRVTTRAEVQPDGTWRIRGHKRYISNLELATHCLVLADGRDADRSGPTLFVVDLRTSGAELTGTYDKLGTHSVGAWRVHLDLTLPAEARLGPVGAGVTTILPSLRYERLAVSCAVLAGARHALGLSVAYLRRRPSGDGRLYDRSTLSHAAAAAQAQLRAAEALVEQVTDLDIAHAATDADYAAAKYHSALTACEVGDVAIQLMGGRGYTVNFPHERIWRDARLGRIGAGTDEMMLEVVARSQDRRSSLDAELDRLMAEDRPRSSSEQVDVDE